MTDCPPKDQNAPAVPDAEDDRIICFCHNVKYCQIVAAIRAGATTLYDIQADTQASTGCGGCEWEVREILEEQLAQAPAAETTKKTGT